MSFCARRRPHTSTYSRRSVTARRRRLLTQQLRRLGPEAKEFFIIFGVLVHPLHRVVERVASIVVLGLLPGGHGQKKGVEANVFSRTQFF